MGRVLDLPDFTERRGTSLQMKMQPVPDFTERRGTSLQMKMQPVPDFTDRMKKENLGKRKKKKRFFTFIH